jgi:HK97 family phage major capsid protein
MKMLEAPDSLVSRVDSITTFSNSITLPVDEETPWGATGINMTSTAEGVAFGQTKPVLKTLNVGLTKYGGLISVTEEMLEDGTNIGDFVTKKASDKLAYVLNAAVLAALTGSGSKLAVAKQAAEAALAAPGLATIQKIWVSCLPQFRRNAVWLVNPILETALQNYTIGNNAVYVPQGGISGAPFATLYGRPILFLEGLAAQGVTGSVILADIGSVYGVFKSNGIRTDVTPYFAFDQDMLTYKVAVRAGFKSKLAAVVTRPDATTASNIVVHATF